MEIKDIINNLYTNTKPDWMRDIDDSEVQPYVIQRWLVMNDRLRVQARWLDKYVFTLPPKMYLSLAWSVIPKMSKPPYVNYIRQAEEDNEFDFILSQVRKQYKMADNDINSMKSRIAQAVKKDMIGWFKYYGADKKQWKKYHLDTDQMKEGG